MRLKRIYHQDKLVRTHQIESGENHQVKEDGSVIKFLNPQMCHRLRETGLSDEQLVTLGYAHSFSSGGVVEVLPGAVRGVQVLQAKQGIQHFSPQFVEGGAQEGWLVMADGFITIRQLHGPDVDYRIVRTPGVYCCHCDKRLGDCGEGSSPANVKRLLSHVKTEHEGTESPDPCNPVGYRQENHYTCYNSTDVNNLSVEEAVELEKQIRQTFYGKVSDKVYSARMAGEVKSQMKK